MCSSDLHLQRLTVIRHDDQIHIEAYADRFLKHMVRAMVGTVVEVGLGKRTPDSLTEILRARDRSAAGQTAPPHGLCLMRVDYDWQAMENHGGLSGSSGCSGLSGPTK